MAVITNLDIETQGLVTIHLFTKKLLVMRVLASIFIFLCASCTGIDKLGKLPLTSHATSTDITINPKHWAIDVGIPNKHDPEYAARFIFVRAFMVNRGKTPVYTDCNRWRDDKTKISEHAKTLLPGGRLLFYEGPLSHCGTGFLEVPERSSPLNLRIEIERVSHLTKDYPLTIYASWGHGIDL